MFLARTMVALVIGLGMFGTMLGGESKGVRGAQQGTSPDVQVLVGAGDIADCESLAGAEATGRLLDTIPGTVFAAGDLAYPDGSEQRFARCYGPAWGRHRPRTRPAPGNHEYRTEGAAAYFHYFGPAAGDPEKGYYSYDLGAWHIVAINSNYSDCSTSKDTFASGGGCQPGTAQMKWLREDLAAHRGPCTLAYWHHPLFSSGEHGNDIKIKPIWRALYEAGADVVLNGHDHDYERFAPQNPDGQLDRARGIREFIVGTGGKSHRSFVHRPANSEVKNNDAFGVLKLTLHEKSYDWEFVPEAGKTFRDSGSGDCH